MSNVGPFPNSNIEVVHIQDHARRGVFAYFLTWKQKVGPGAGKAHKESNTTK
jgi:hypothetical protein